MNPRVSHLRRALWMYRNANTKMHTAKQEACGKGALELLFSAYLQSDVGNARSVPTTLLPC